jgi:hypothetical protein
VDRRTRVLFAALFAAIVILTAVAAVLLSETGVVDPDLPAGTTDMSDMTGVVVGVDSSGLADVRGFTLRIAGGELVEFSLRALTNESEFAPGHLAEHQATAEPVRVWWRMDGAERLAIRLEDAPP